MQLLKSIRLAGECCNSLAISPNCLDKVLPLLRSLAYVRLGNMPVLSCSSPKPRFRKGVIKAGKEGKPETPACQGHPWKRMKTYEHIFKTWRRMLFAASKQWLAYDTVYGRILFATCANLWPWAGLRFHRSGHSSVAHVAESRLIRLTLVVLRTFARNYRLES